MRRKEVSAIYLILLYDLPQREMLLYDLPQREMLLPSCLPDVFSLGACIRGSISTNYVTSLANSYFSPFFGLKTSDSLAPDFYKTFPLSGIKLSICGSSRSGRSLRCVTINCFRIGSSCSLYVRWPIRLFVAGDSFPSCLFVIQGSSTIAAYLHATEMPFAFPLECPTAASKCRKKP